MGPDGLLHTVVGLCHSAAIHWRTDGVQATSTTLDQPYGLALAPGSRRLYIADHGHSAMRVVTLAAPLTGSPTRSSTRSQSRSRTATRSQSSTRSTTRSKSRTRKAKPP